MIILLLALIGILYLLYIILRGIINALLANKEYFPKRCVISTLPVLTAALIYAFLISYGEDTLYSFEKIAPPTIMKHVSQSLTIGDEGFSEHFSSSYEYYGQYGDVIVLKTYAESISKDYADTKACCLIDKSGRLLTRGNEYYVYVGESRSLTYQGEPVIACEHRLINLSGGTRLFNGEMTYYSFHGRELSQSELDQKPLSNENDTGQQAYIKYYYLNGSSMTPKDDLGYYSYCEAIDKDGSTVFSRKADEAGNIELCEHIFCVDIANNIAAAAVFSVGDQECYLGFFSLDGELIARADIDSLIANEDGAWTTDTRHTRHPLDMKIMGKYIDIEHYTGSVLFDLHSKGSVSTAYHNIEQYDDEHLISYDEASDTTYLFSVNDKAVQEISGRLYRPTGDIICLKYNDSYSFYTKE